MSKVDENAFSRKVAALEVAQNRVMSNFTATTLSAGAISSRYLTLLVTIGSRITPIVTNELRYRDEIASALDVARCDVAHHTILRNL